MRAGALRNALAVLLGVALIFGLMALFGAVELAFTDTRVVSDLAAQGPAAQVLRAHPERVFESLRKALLRSRLLYGPLTAFLVALVVGLIADRSRLVAVALALIPLLFMVFDREPSVPLAIALCILYLSIALLVAEFVHRWRREHAPSGPTA